MSWCQILNFSSCCLLKGSTFPPHLFEADNFHLFPLRNALALPGSSLNWEQHPSSRAHGSSQGPCLTTGLQIILPDTPLGSCHPHSQIQTTPFSCPLHKGQHPSLSSQKVEQKLASGSRPINSAPVHSPLGWSTGTSCRNLCRCSDSISYQHH